MNECVVWFAFRFSLASFCLSSTKMPAERMLKKEDQPVFFPDLPELDIPEINNKESDIKQITLNKTDPILNNPKDLKSITIDPNYVSKD